MKKLLAPAITGVIFLSFIPSVASALDLSALFPNLALIYSAAENAARSIIPDEIEELVSALSDKLT